MVKPRWWRIAGFLAVWLVVGAAAISSARAEPWDLAAKPAEDPLPASAAVKPDRAPAGPTGNAALDALGQGVTLVLSGQPGEGATRLAGISGLGGLLADVAAYYQGLGRYLDGQPAQARQILADVARRAATSFLGSDALYLSTLCAAREGDPAATLHLAEAWLIAPNPALAPQIWLRAAVAAQALGDTAKAQEYLRHLSLFAPWTKAAKAGDAFARTLRAGAAGALSAYDPDAPGNVLLRAEALVEKGYPAAALELLHQAPAAQTGTVPRAVYIQGKALYALRRTQAAAAAFARAAAMDPTAPLAGWALYHEARCLWRSLEADDAARMEALLRQVLALPGRDDRLREAAARHLALMLTEQGRFADALTAAESLTGLAVSPDLAAQGASLTAVLRLATGDTAGAEAACAAFLTRFPNDPWADGARYWRAKALIALGRSDEAAALARTVVAHRPNTYYGGRAATLLAAVAGTAPAAGDAAPAAEAGEPRCPQTPEPSDPEAAATMADAAVLTRLGLGALAEKALGYASRLAHARIDLAMAHIRAADAVGARAAVLRTAWRTFGGCLLRGTAQDLEPLRTALYPRSNARQVQSALAGTKVSPDILYSLIRQESFFDPRAVSGAGAVGLMQLLPTTAQTVGRRLGLRVTREDLFRPDINIRVGTAYFLERLERSGNLPAALAGYNAGENRVALWTRTLGPLGEELFIELIPYAETRDYVRRILANAMMYGRLYPASAPSAD